MKTAGSQDFISKSNREVYLDLVKFFAMIMMVAGHSFFELANPDTYSLNLFPWNWWNFARGKTAPTFLFLSGAVHVFANFKNSTTGISNQLLKKRINMALILLLIGYLLNSPINSIDDFYNINDEKLRIFLQVNILQIFGIGLFILALIYKFANNPNKVFIYSFVLAIISTLIAPFFIHNDLEFLPLFIRNYFNYKSGSVFVIFPYISYLLFGTCFGVISYKTKQKNKINKSQNFIEKSVSNYNFLISAVLLIISGIFITKIMIYCGIKLDLRSSTGILIRNLGIIMLILFIIKNIKIQSKKLINLISILSKRAIYIYVIHLFIIYGIGNLRGLKHFYGHNFNPIPALGVSILVIILSILITLFIDYLIMKNKIKHFLISSIILYWIYFLLQ